MMFWEFNPKYSSNIACIEESTGLILTYCEFFSAIKEVELEISHSTKKLVLVLTDNSIISLILYLAALRCGHAVMLIEAGISETMLSTIIKDYQIDLILSRTLLNKTFCASDEKQIFKQKYYRSNFKNIDEFQIFPDLALMLTTSGSTGSSKFVKLTKLNLQANASSIVKYLSICQDQIAITTLPMHYSFGLSIVNTHLLAGACLVLTNKSVVQKEFWKIFNHYNCTTFSGVPYTYQMLEKLNFDKMELPTLQYFTQAGGHLNSETKRYFVEFALKKNKKFIVMYGQTEATARISYVPFENLKSKIESIGISIPDGCIRIYDEKNEIKKPGIIGEIVYEGPNVMLGYATSKSSLLLGDELKGILRTGDLGKFDKEGFYFVTGRMKRFLKVFGNRISLDEIERLIEVEFSLPFGVTGIDDKICILGENSSIEKDIIEFLALKLGIHRSAFYYTAISKLPVSANGKKDYSKMKELFGI